jgi:hypothetical protein
MSAEQCRIFNQPILLAIAIAGSGDELQPHAERMISRLTAP